LTSASHDLGRTGIEGTASPSPSPSPWRALFIMLLSLVMAPITLARCRHIEMDA
jgi:hypothetical protein